MKVIQLTNSQLAASVNDEDFAFLVRYKWRESPYGYAYRSHRESAQHMHRVVMERMLGRRLESRELVDHRDRDQMNNSRGNLRLASHAENHANSRARRDGLKGAYLSRGRWYCSMNVDGKKHHIGVFDTEEEAAWMYDQWASQVWGEFAGLNFDYQ